MAQEVDKVDPISQCTYSLDIGPLDTCMVKPISDKQVAEGTIVHTKNFL